MTRRLLLAAIAMGAILVTPAAALAATPFSYHTIVDRSAVTSFNAQSGDLATAVWVSTTDQHMAYKPGDTPRIFRGSLTSVEIIVQDVTRPAGKGYLTVADWFGQVEDSGWFRNNLDAAALTLTIPVTDQVSGDSGTVELSVSWIATGPPDGSPSHVHVRYPGVVTINSNANEWMRPATAVGSVVLDGTSIVSASSDPAAMLFSTKFNCRQVGYRNSFDWGQCI